MHVCGARALAAVLTVATLAGSTLSPTGGARVREGPVALQKLEVAPGTLKPVFNGTRTGPYTVSLPFGTDTLKLTATVSRSGSPTIKVQVAGGSTIPVTHGVPCAVPLKKFGNTTMQVQVKGSDSATMVYNVIAVKPPEPDASLKLLTITSTGAPGKLQVWLRWLAPASAAFDWSALSHVCALWYTADVQAVDYELFNFGRCADTYSRDHGCGQRLFCAGQD